MSTEIKSVAGISGAALLVVLATNAKPLFEGLNAGWIFISNVTSKATLGIGAFMVSILLCTALMWWLDKWLPPSLTIRGRYGRSFFIESIIGIVGILAVWFQMETMMGLLIGTIAGLSAPLAYKAIAGLCSWIAAMFRNKLP